MHNPSIANTPPNPHRPGPRLPAFGMLMMRAMSQDYLGTMEQLQRDHGDIVYMQLLWEASCAVLTPELTRAVLVDHAAQLERYDRAREVFAGAQGQHSIMVTEGDTWQRQHRILLPGFAPRRMAGYAALMTDAIAAGLDRITPPQSGAAAQVEIDLMTGAITMDVILRTLFSTSLLPEHAETVTRAVQALDRRAMRELFWPMTLPDWLPLPGKAEKRWALRTLDQLITGHISARHSANAADAAPHDDLLAMLLAARDESVGDGTQGLSADEIRDQCMVIFLAGHETTATAMQWWMCLMAEHRTAMDRARHEVDTVLGTRAPTAADVAQLPWLVASIKETLRLYPSAPALLTRRALADLHVGNWTIPKDTLIFTLPWILQRDARWFPDPTAFRPDRFMPDASPLPRGAWMPFGTGPRVCIGQHLAMLELTLMTAMLLQRYDIHVPAGMQRPAPELHVTLRPPPGIKLTLERRLR